MVYELKGKDLKYAAEHVVVCRAHRNKDCRVLVEADDEQSWGRLQTKLKSVYKAVSVKDNSGDDLDFSLVFDTKKRRDEVVNDINDAIETYLDNNPDIDSPYTPTVPESPDPEDTENETKTIDWTTYIVIGAAVVAIVVLLLWDRKRK